MKRLKLLVLFTLLASAAFAQNSMGVGTDTPNPNAVLEIVSPTGNQGILIPRYTTTERTATAFTSNLTNSDNGLLVFDTDEGALYFWFGGQWVTMANQSLSDLLGVDNSAGGETITGLADPVNDTDAVNKAYTDSLITGIVYPTFSDLLTSDNDAGGELITNLADPLGAQDAATRSYVDTAVSSISIEDPIFSELLAADNDAGGSGITNMADPINAQDAATKSYIDTSISDSLATISIPSFSELLVADNDAGGAGITNMADPTDAQDAATKSYIDTSISDSLATISNPSFSELLVTDNDAGGSGITNMADPTNSQDAATKNYIDTQISGVDTALWSYSTGDLHYNHGKVGVGTTQPLSAFQVQDRMHFFDFQVDSIGVDGRVISDNISYDGAGMLNVEDGRSAFLFMSDGNMEFLTGDSLGAGSDAFNSISTTLTLKNNRHAEFRGAIEVGQVRDSTDISSGLIAYSGGGFYGFNGSEWVNFGGLSFPFYATADPGGNMFDLENTGYGSVGYFNASNTANTSNAVNIISNSDNNGTAALYVNHDGLGPVAEFNITDATNAEDAIAARTVGIGSAGYFEIDNASNNGYAVDARINNGTGRAINGYTAGLGQAARFTLDNASNSSIAFNVSSNGTNSTAYFSNTNSGTSSATVEIQNSGTGAGLTIQNPGGTTSFGDVSFINGDLGIGQFTPSAKLDVVGDTELNGNVTTTGNLTTGGAVISNAISTGSISYPVSNTDHIIALSGASAQTVTLPLAASNPGRELIIMVTSTGTVTHSIQLQGADNYKFEGQTLTTPISMSIIYGEIVCITLRAIGNNWFVVNTILSNNV